MKLSPFSKVFSWLSGVRILFSPNKGYPPKKEWGAEVRAFLVTFDESATAFLDGAMKSYEFDVEWVQKSVVKLNDLGVAEEFTGRLHEFGVQNVKIFLAADFTGEWKST